MERSGGPIVHRLERATSTQWVARELVDQGTACAGHIIVADEQTAGRGRHGRPWRSPSGGLYATFIIPNDPLIAVRAGVAASRAVEALGLAVRLKWPNDLVLGENKLGGILIETREALAFVGVGINLEASPIETATSARAAGVRGDCNLLVLAIHDSLQNPEADGAVLAAYRERSATLGHVVRVDAGCGRTLFGRAVDVDSLGRLIVETADGRVTVASGDCLHLREIPASDRSL